MSDELELAEVDPELLELRAGLTPVQLEVVDELGRVLEQFAGVLEACRANELPVVDAFRAAGIAVPSWVPAPLLENLLGG